MPKSAHTYKRHQESLHGKRDLVSRKNSHPFSYFSSAGYGIFLIQVHKSVRGKKPNQQTHYLGIRGFKLPSDLEPLFT